MNMFLNSTMTEVALPHRPPTRRGWPSRNLGRRPDWGWKSSQAAVVLRFWTKQQVSMFMHFPLFHWCWAGCASWSSCSNRTWPLGWACFRLKSDTVKIFEAGFVSLPLRWFRDVRQLESRHSVIASLYWWRCFPANPKIAGDDVHSCYWWLSSSLHSTQQAASTSTWESSDKLHETGSLCRTMYNSHQLRAGFISVQQSKTYTCVHVGDVIFTQ